MNERFNTLIISSSSFNYSAFREYFRKNENTLLFDFREFYSFKNGFEKNYLLEDLVNYKNIPKLVWFK